MNRTTLQAFHDELEKIALRAGARVIQRLVQQGTPEALEQAGRLAKTPGVLKPSALGSQIKHLGRGGEGVADVVAHPQYGVSVRKLYDPTSMISSPTMIGRKLQLAKQVDSPLMAKTHGFARTGRGGKASFHEYVPGAAPTPAAESQIKSQLQQAGAQKGYQLEDIRSANIRGGKAIDVLPFHQGEAVGMSGSGGNVLQLTPQGMKKFTPHMEKAYGRTEGGLSEKGLYSLMGGGGAKGKSLQEIGTAPARAPISLPQRAAPTPSMQAKTVPSGPIPTANPSDVVSVPTATAAPVKTMKLPKALQAQG